MKSPGKSLCLCIFLCILISLIISILDSNSYAYEYEKTNIDTIKLDYKPEDIFLFDINNLKYYGYDNANSSLLLSLESNDNKNTYCYYDLYLKFTNINPLDLLFNYRLLYERNSGLNKSQKTIELLNGLDNINYSQMGLKIVSNEVIHTNSNIEVKYNFNNLMYKAKDIAFDSDIKAYIYPVIKSCFAKEYENGVYHYFISDNDMYKEVFDIPKTSDINRYTLDSDKSYCVKKGTIQGYDSINGHISGPKDDECYLYFNE